MATRLHAVEPAADALDDMSLPGWLYFDPEFFEAEKRAFLRAAPQEACLRSFARKLRRLIAEARAERPPAPGWSARPAS